MRSRYLDRHANSCLAMTQTACQNENSPLHTKTITGAKMDIFISALIALLSGMGVGGGGLFALYLKYFSELSQIEIQTVNLIFFLAASATALLLHLLRQKIYFAAIAIMLPLGVIGTLLGSSLALRLDGNILGKLFGVILAALGLFGIIKNFKKAK